MYYVILHLESSPQLWILKNWDQGEVSHMCFLFLMGPDLCNLRHELCNLPWLFPFKDQKIKVRPLSVVLHRAGEFLRKVSCVKTLNILKEGYQIQSLQN